MIAIETSTVIAEKGVRLRHRDARQSETSAILAIREIFRHVTWMLAVRAATRGMAHLRQGLHSRILLCLAPGRPTAAVGLDEAEVEGTLVGEEGLFTTMIATDTMIHGIVHQTVLTGHVAGHRCVEIETCETTGISTEGTVMIAVFPGSTTLT